MNASEIIAAKQNKLLYQSLYRSQSTSTAVYSTIRPISSIMTSISSGVPIAATSYASCLVTVPQYACAPRFMSYETARAAAAGANECGDRVVGESDWIKSVSTATQAYIVSYSTLSTVSSVRVTSLLTATAPGPLICSAADVRQGTAFSAHCGGGASCPACTGSS